MDNALNQSEEHEGPVDPVDNEQNGPWTYMHKAIRNFHIGGFEFTNGLLRIEDPKQHDIWLSLYEQMPPAERQPIVRYRPELLAQLESPVRAPKTQALRGVMTTNMVKDTKALSSDAGAKIQLNK